MPRSAYGLHVCIRPTLLTLSDIDDVDTKLSVRLSEEDFAALVRMAEADRRTVSFMAREAIRTYLAPHKIEEESTTCV